jgi:hypothetical protein
MQARFVPAGTLVGFEPKLLGGDDNIVEELHVPVDA